MNTENHYQETDLGNISLNPRGEYNPEESYEYLDLVVLEGGSYVCLAENGATITGISPESGKTTQYWQVITIPGSLTSEYIAMHDRVVNLSEQVGADAEEVRTAEQNVSGMELNVTQMQEQTRQSAEAAEQSKDSSAGYAASADASRQAAEESEQNVNAQVSGFDNHVAEKVGEAENDIEAARIAANKAIIAQQEQSVNEVARAGIEAISTAQSAAQTATEKAQAAATSEKNAAASETAAKLSETNATKMAEQVAADKEQVANDRTAVENAKQEMTESVAQIEQNTQGISELKGDLVELDSQLSESITEISDGVIQYLNIERRYVFTKENREGSFHYAEYKFTKGKAYYISVDEGSAVAPIIRLKKEKSGSTIQTIGKVEIGQRLLFNAVDDMSVAQLYFEPLLVSNESAVVRIENVGTMASIPSKVNALENTVSKHDTDIAKNGDTLDKVQTVNYAPFINGNTVHGVTFEKIINGYRYNGNGDAPFTFTLFGEDNKLPNGMSAGEYYVNYYNTDNKLRFAIFAKVSGNFVLLFDASSNKSEKLVIPDGTTGMIIRLYTNEATTLNGEVHIAITKSFMVTKEEIDGMNYKIDNIGHAVLSNNTPEYYGAVGDGVNDDTSAIMTMFRNGLDTYVFNNKYKISGIDVPNRDITLCGNGTIIVTGLGFIFNAPQSHKVIKDLKFVLENTASFAIRTDGKPEDTGICTLKIDNVQIKAQQMSNKYGIYMQGETSALLSNINLEGCGIRILNCTNPTLTNGVIMYTQTAIYNGFVQDEHGTTESYACGLNVHGTTVVGNTVGIKVVCVDSVIISESMFDFNDNPVVILGTEEPKLLSSYFSSRQGNPVVWMDKNNALDGVHGGNGLSTEEMHFVSIQDCVFIQYQESLANPTLHIGNCEYFDIHGLNIMYAGKAGIELVNARNGLIDSVICNTKIEGAKCLISYGKDGSLTDDSSNKYTNFFTSLPIYVRYAKTDIDCPSYKSMSKGSTVIGETTQQKTFENIIPQGVEWAIVGTNDGTKVWYQESGKNLIVMTESHSNPIRVNYIAYGKKTHEGWS